MKRIIDLLMADWRRKKYIKAMLKAIDKAREPVLIGEAQESKTNGLRVIKRFERVNKTKFDPFNKFHVYFIHGCASHESFFRRARWALDGARLRIGKKRV